MTENIVVTQFMPAAPERVFNAWLSSEEHAKMTQAHVQFERDGHYCAWNGYIEGHVVESVPHSKIVQRWRTTEFPEDAPDSLLTVLLEPVEGGTQLTIRHENLPEGQGAGYELGWKDYYLEPMASYFASTSSRIRRVGEAIRRATSSETSQVSDRRRTQR